MSRRLSASLLAWLLPLGLLSCRALTEPGLVPQPNGATLRVAGQAFLPDGSPAAEGELLLDNRIYEEDREDWVQVRVALDSEGRFDTRVRLGELTDVILDPAGMDGPPSHRFLGLRTSAVPWTLHHPMREVALSLDLPESLVAEIDDGQLRLRTHRPRPAGQNAFSENYLLPVDSTATARGWILPGAHEVEIVLEHGGDSRFQFEFPDSVDSPADGIPSLRPWLREQYVELVLPEGIPGSRRIEFFAAQSLRGETTAGRVWTWTAISTELGRAWAILPQEVHLAELQSTDLVLLSRPLIDYDAGVEPVRVADHWLEVVAPPAAGYAWVALSSGVASSGEVPLSDGRALFLLDRGSHYIEVLDADHEVVAQRVYESNRSQTLLLDF